jgi:iron complex outermembrane receptor protein
MARPCTRHFTPLASAVLALCCAPAQAQTEPDPDKQLPAVTVTGRAAGGTAQVSGFGDTPLPRTPLVATVISAEQVDDSGSRRLADLTRFDAGVSDAYNAEGYWSSFTVRGFTIDNRYNFRRDGLPINAETSIALENKSAIEILKGTSGIQAGTSAPGGLVNLAVKRPEGRVRSASIGWRQDHSLGAWVDLGQRFWDGTFGLRVNAGYEHLDPRTRDLEGHRSVLAVAGDWRIGRDTLLEAEFESSRQTQPSAPGFSLLGDSVPDASRIDPRINLNNQPWSKPVVLNGDTASLRLQHRLNESWRAIAHAGAQRLKSNDRLAFPFGCSAEENFDRYCSDGTYDLYDYRSDGERRDTHALDLGLRGKLQAAGIGHDLSAGVLLTRFRARFQQQVNNFAGTGNIDGTLVTPPAPESLSPSANRDERSTELYLRDAITLTERWSAWLGLRHTRLHRESVLTNGNEPTEYRQSFTTPWLGAGYLLSPSLMAYASWGRGMETEVVPNRPRYTNQGQALSLESRQLEVGIKRDEGDLNWGLALFQIDRPRYANVGSGCLSGNTDNSCTRQADGQQRHRGIEAEVGLREGPFDIHASAMLLDAKLRKVTSDASLNGKQPINVPERALKLHGLYRLDAVPGLSVGAGLVYEGERKVLADNSVSIPSWTRVDALLRYQHALGMRSLTWLAGVDNLTDKRAWREAPFQFDHVYLYPLAPRTWRVSLQVEL